MKVIFWGCRGSLPTPLNAREVRRKVLEGVRAAARAGLADESGAEALLEGLPFAVAGTYGGNTSCVQVEGGAEYLVLDAGTGLRDLGNHLLQEGRLRAPAVFHLLLSHLHWDHLQGFPFFAPAYIPHCRIHVHGCHPGLEEALRSQQAEPHFPVPFDFFPAGIDFQTLEPGGEYQVGGFLVRPFVQNHPQDSFGYRLEREGKVVVYATDAEHDMARPDWLARATRDFEGADLLIFDAQYTFRETLENKVNWGHSSNLMAVEMANQAGVDHLCLFHHEPTYGDLQLERIHQDTMRFAKAFAQMNQAPHPRLVSMAYDGLEVEV